MHFCEIGVNMRRLSFAAAILLGVISQPAWARIEILLPGTPHTSGQGSEIERSIAIIFDNEFGYWTRVFPKGSKVTIDHCTLRIEGHRRGIPFEGTVNFS